MRMQLNLPEQVYLENCSNFYEITRLDSDPSNAVQHSHDYYQVCYVTRGSLIHKHENTGVTLNAGDCFIIPPAFKHSTEILAKDTEGCFLSFQESLFHPDYQFTSAYKFLAALRLDTMNGQHIDITLKIAMPGRDAAAFMGLIDCLIYERSLNLERQNSNANSLISAMITIIARNYFDEPQMEERLKKINEYSQIMLECKTYIDENFMYPLTVAQLSRKFAVSTSTFGIMFPRIAGLPFKQYLNRKRISNAVILCAVDSLTLQEICGMCGFSDFSTFYRNFIKYTGISPSIYREKHVKMV